VEEPIKVGLECAVKVFLSLLMERIERLGALVPLGAHLLGDALEAGGLAEDLVDLLLGLDTEDLLDLVRRAVVHLVQQGHLLAAHHILDVHQNINVTLAQLRLKCCFPVFKPLVLAELRSGEVIESRLCRGIFREDFLKKGSFLLLNEAKLEESVDLVVVFVLNDTAQLVNCEGFLD
jgi:hypothetical protein